MSKIKSGAGARRGSRQIRPQFDNFSAGGESDSGALIFGFTPEFFIQSEYVFFVLRVKANAIVRQRKKDHVFLNVAFDVHCRSFASMKLDAVCDKILKKLGEQKRVSTDDRQTPVSDLRSRL